MNSIRSHYSLMIQLDPKGDSKGDPKGDPKGDAKGGPKSVWCKKINHVTNRDFKIQIF